MLTMPFILWFDLASLCHHKSEIIRMIIEQEKKMNLLTEAKKTESPLKKRFMQKLFLG